MASTIKNINAIAVPVSGSPNTYAKLDIKPINENIKKLTDVIGENAENAALKTTQNTFVDKQTFNNGIEFSKVDHNNIVMNTGIAANASASTPLGLNMTLMSSDGKKFGSVILGVDGTNRTAKLVVNKNDGSVAGTLGIESDGATDGKATAPNFTTFEGVDDTRIMTFGAVKEMFKQASEDPDTENPLIPHASEDKSGIIELATQAEVTSGTDALRAVTPKTLKVVTDSIHAEIRSIKKATRELAYKDYTQTGNQSDMKEGVYYMVPFNKSNVFVEFDPATGKPKPNTGGGDPKVAYYTVMYKEVGGDGTVSNVGQENTNVDWENLAKLDSTNTFTKANTFTGGLTVSSGISVDTVTASGNITSAGAISGGTLSIGTTSNLVGAITAGNVITCATGATVESGGNNVPNAGQVKTFVEGFKPQLVTALPEASAMKDGVLYLEYEA